MSCDCKKPGVCRCVRPEPCQCDVPWGVSTELMPAAGGLPDLRLFKTRFIKATLCGDVFLNGEFEVGCNAILSAEPYIVSNCDCDIFVVFPPCTVLRFTTKRVGSANARRREVRPAPSRRCSATTREPTTTRGNARWWKRALTAVCVPIAIWPGSRTSVAPSRTTNMMWLWAR